MFLFRKSSFAASFAVAIALLGPALAAQTAGALFASAKSEAQAEHKDILLVFSASWCGPCKMYESYLEDPRMKPINDRAFEIVRIDVGERTGDPRHADTPGGAQLRTALGGVGEPGFPFIVITDAGGKPIVNSYREARKGANIGYPEAPEEIDWYLAMLGHVPAVSAEDRAATQTWLKQHARR